MKLNKKSLALSMVAGAILASSYGYAGTMGSSMVAPGTMYIGVFGGAGASEDMGISQYGTAFFTEAAGGPLAVNAFGTANSGTVGIVGGQVGYQWSQLSFYNALAEISPATELEGYYLGKGNFSGHEINNDTTRLPEHDFLNTYPTETGVFLINAVANLNLPSQPMVRPYVGAGIGAGIVSISDAESIQVSPVEAGVNHYNSNPSSLDAAFAAQVKAGLSFHLTQNLDLFGEYRWLYLSSTNHTFGSTVYTGHAATSSWAVKFGSQDYNLGSVGLRYSV